MNTASVMCVHSFFRWRKSQRGSVRMKSKPLPPLKKIWREGDEEEDTEGSQEGLEMKDLVEEDKDYYFEDPSNIGVSSLD